MRREPARTATDEPRGGRRGPIAAPGACRSVRSAPARPSAVRLPRVFRVGFVEEQPAVLIESCLPGDPRFGRWSRAAAVALASPSGQAQSEDAVAALRADGFAVSLFGEAPPSRPSGEGSGWSGPGGSWSGLAVSLLAVAAAAAFLAAAGCFLLCGKPTADGGRCRNPAESCTVDHKGIRRKNKGKRRKKRDRARAAVAVVADRAEGALPPSWKSKVRQANSFNPVGSGTDGLIKAAETLDDAGLTAAPPRPGSDLPDVKVTDLVALLLDQDRAGFTISPFGWETSRERLEAEARAGICVALDTTPLHTPKNFRPGNEDDLAGFQVELANWVQEMWPVLETGNVWIGGWRQPDGTMEVNLTCVFRPEHRHKAIRFGRMQDQKAVWDLEDEQGGGIDTHGGGGTTWHDSERQRLAPSG